MFFSRSRLATSTHSSILWMLALTGPNSITCGQIFAMKRPSEVPPVVESSAAMPACSRIASASASPSAARGGEERLAAERPGDLERRGRACVSSSSTRAFSDSGVDSVQKRKLKSTTTSPGITLPAPVPAWMFDTCQLVGGKYALPRSHSMRDQFGQRRRDQVDRVLRQLRVGDVALHARAPRSLPLRRAAAAVLDHVAERARPRSARRRCSSRAARRAPPASRRPRPCRRPPGLPRRW